jgi:hypothetical protein
MPTTHNPSVGRGMGLAALPLCWIGRNISTGLATACLMFSVGASSAMADGATHVPARQQLAVLLAPHWAHKEPLAGSAQTELVPSTRPITGEQTTLPVTGSLTGADGVRWLQVMLPGRPNSSTGWVLQKGTRETVTGWHIVVDLQARRVRVYRDGHSLKTFQAVVGKPTTPTPTGKFFVEETLQMPAGEPGGPFALALSARSNVLQEFEGGPGQIGIHGRDNLGGVLGNAESHGCVRLDTASIDWLAARIGAGTPVTIDAG